MTETKHNDSVCVVSQSAIYTLCRPHTAVSTAALSSGERGGGGFVAECAEIFRAAERLMSSPMAGYTTLFIAPGVASCMLSSMG